MTMLITNLNSLFVEIDRLGVQSYINSRWIDGDDVNFPTMHYDVTLTWKDAGGNKTWVNATGEGRTLYEAMKQAYERIDRMHQAMTVQPVPDAPTILPSELGEGPAAPPFGDDIPF